MASILRTGKFLRCFAGFSRNIVVNSVRDNESSNLLQSSTCMCQQFQQGFANTVAPKTDLSLERQLRRLDNDVRRIGRISRRDIEDVIEEIRTQRSATSSQSLLVIRCCGNLVPEELPEVRTALVHEIWKTLQALNVPMDISHYNALLRVYLENDYEFSPTDFLSQLEANAIEPNRVTYQRLIARYCQQGDIEGATRILEFMREKKLPVNENVFNSLILGHSQANDMESAVGILSVMKQAGLEPTADTYTTLLCCYARHGNLDAILSTIDECEKKEVFLLDKDLLDVIYHLTVNGHADKIDPVLRKLRLAVGFNQDAVNVILRLVNRGFEDVGLKILYIMPRGPRADGQLVDVGTFLIKQMVRANRPIEKILSFCKTLQDEGLNSKALLIATEVGLTQGMVDKALPLLKEMKKAGLPIRQHYFWPLICAVESNQILDILRRMQDEFSVYPNSETIRDYVIPNLKEKNWDRIINILRDAGIPGGIAASSAAYAALVSHQINDAAAIMESNKAYYSPRIFRQQMIQALGKSNDYNAFVRTLRQLYESVQRNAEQKSESNEQDKDENEAAETEEVKTFDVVGTILYDICGILTRERIQHLTNILPLLVKQGLSISNINATRISERIGSEMTPEIAKLLGKLSSGELEVSPLSKIGSNKRGLDALTIEELERFISQLEAKGENANNIKRQLLTACFRSKKLEKSLEVIGKLESENYAMHSGVYAQLIDLYAHHKKVPEALALLEKLKAKDPAFFLDNMKMMHIVELLLEEDRFEDALKFLEDNKKAEPFNEGEGSFTYSSIAWRILNSLAEAGNVQHLNRLFEVLEKGNYIIPSNVLLGPLVKVHLVKDDIQGAIETFEKICEKYKATPWKNELACRLIQKEDAANLQKLTDLSTNIHGEVNSLYDLVFSFVECGRIRQARKILETPGMRTRPYRISYACERYQSEGLVEPLEGLIEATKDLNHIDRDKIYYNLLLSYCKSGDAEKALGLWTKMQEENIAPSDIFLTKLADLLKSKNMKIPFVVTETAAKAPETEKPVVVTEKKAKRTSLPQEPKTPISNFRNALNLNDVDAAIKIANELKETKDLNVFDLSRLIEILVRERKLTEATKYVNEMLDNKTYPQPKVFRFYLNKIAFAGDLEAMKQISNKISNEQKRLLSFDNRYCSAYINAGKTEEYLKHLTDEIMAVKSTEEAAALGEKFPRGGAFGILEKMPDNVQLFQNLAEKYAEHNLLGPMNVLWMHLVSKGDEAASKAIWQKYLSNAPRLMFQRILQTARDQKDEKMAESLIAQIRDSKVSEGAIGNAYSCLIDIHASNENYDKALTTLQTALKDVSLEHINRTALIRLKTALEEQKKEFPYKIPEKKLAADSSSSSSSSSDDDVPPNRPETRPRKPSNKN